MKPRKVGTADWLQIRCQCRESLFICRPVFNLTWTVFVLFYRSRKMRARIFRQTGSKMFSSFRQSLKFYLRCKRVNWKPQNISVLISPFDALAQYQINVIQAVSCINHISLCISFNILLFTLRCEQLWGSPAHFTAEYLTVPWGHAVSFHCDGASCGHGEQRICSGCGLLSRPSRSGFRKL